VSETASTPAMDWLRERGHRTRDGRCEVCWSEAQLRALSDPEGYVSEAYYKVMGEWEDRALEATKNGGPQHPSGERSGEDGAWGPPDSEDD
jgi:hypothetical protein